MTEQDTKRFTMEWVKDVIVVLTVIGTAFGAYLNLSERVTAAEQHIVAMEGAIGDYKDVPAALARIEEQINGTRRDIAKLENRIR